MEVSRQNPTKKEKVNFKCYILMETIDGIHINWTVFDAPMKCFSLKLTYLWPDTQLEYLLNY